MCKWGVLRETTTPSRALQSEIRHWFWLLPAPQLLAGTFDKFRKQKRDLLITDLSSWSAANQGEEKQNLLRTIAASTEERRMR